MPSQENEKARDGLLRRSLAHDSVASGDCPDAEFLAAYFDQSLGADEAARYELHFSQCTRCREQLAAMARASGEQTADAALGPALVGARPAQAIAWEPERAATQAKPAAPFEVKAPARKSTDSRWLNPKWLIPVAAMLVLGTLIFMRFASHEATIGLDNQIAMSKSSLPPQEQAAREPEKKASDVGTSDKSVPKNEPSAAGKRSSPQSSAKPAASAAPNSESTRAQRSEGASSRGGAASTSVGPGASGPPVNTEKAPVYVFHSPEWSTTEAPTQKKSKKGKFPTESAPAAPAPELNASLPKIAVATDSANAVKSPAPAPPPSAEQKSQAFGVTGQSLRGSTATKSLAKTKPAQARYTETVITTPDSDVFYRIATGGFVEISEDGGVTWQRQLLNPSAQFTAGSAPEPRICWLVGRSGIVFLTDDGKNWRQIPSPTSEDLIAVVAKSASNATVASDDDRKWTTDDAGKSWHAVK